MKLVAESVFPDPIEDLKYQRKMGLILLGMSFFFLFPVFIAYDLGNLSPSDPGSIVFVLLFSSPLILCVPVVVLKWNDDRCTATWWIKMARSEGRTWLFSGILDSDIVGALHDANLGYVRRRQEAKWGTELFLGKGYRYMMLNGLYILWSGGSQSSFLTRTPIYQFYLTIGGIRTENQVQALLIYERLTGIRLIKKARATLPHQT